jgi:hypothetical protein
MLLESIGQHGIELLTLGYHENVIITEPLPEQLKVGRVIDDPTGAHILSKGRE